MSDGNFIKDPDARLDFVIDWSTWLASAETITSSTWTVSTGIVVEDDTIFDTTSTTIWLSGGTVGMLYQASCLIETSQTRRDERTITIRIVER